MRRWLHIATLTALGCSGGDGGSIPVLNLAEPTCFYAERQAIQARDECIRLVPGEEAETRFLSEADTSCEGTACLLLRPGERGVVIGPIDVAYADYDLSYDCSPCP